jgi:hypothetical protein
MTMTVDESDLVEEHPSPRRRWDERTRQLLDDWHLRATAAQFGHLAQAEQTRRKSIWLGLPVVIMTTLVGTSAFATFNGNSSPEAKILVGVISIAAAVLASIQTFLGYSQVAERHRIAATRYANTRRAIELALTRHDAAAVDGIRSEMDKVGGASPQIGSRDWDRAIVVAGKAIKEWRAGEVIDLEAPEPAGPPPRHARTVAPPT